MKKCLLLCIWLPMLHAMSEPQKKPMTPTELATVLSLHLFDREDKELIAAFSQILTKDKKGNLALVEMRYRMLSVLEQEALCKSKSYPQLPVL